MLEAITSVVLLLLWQVAVLSSGSDTSLENTTILLFVSITIKPG